MTKEEQAIRWQLWEAYRSAEALAQHFDCSRLRFATDLLAAEFRDRYGSQVPPRVLPDRPKPENFDSIQVQAAPVRISRPEPMSFPVNRTDKWP